MEQNQSKTMEPLLIIGAGGFGREVLSMLNSMSSGMQIGAPSGFIDDGIPKGTILNSLPVLGGLEVLNEYSEAALVIAVGNGRTREHILSKIDLRKFTFPNVIHPSALFQAPQRIKMGHGNIICAGNIFTVDIEMGDFCVINLGCTIGHDAVLEDFTSLMPGVHISGGAKIRKGAYIGTGANLIKATEIGSGSIIGAGSMVDRDIPNQVTAVGVPCRIIRDNL
jgi:sugar O-acyltransferase (sialic acid O-acetyltransferase NeuD family)